MNQPGDEAPARRVLSQFSREFASADLTNLGGNGGFSGANLWKITAGGGIYCLRRWPAEHPSAERLAYQHGVLQHASLGGISFVPVPLRTVQNETHLWSDNRMWELTPWMPGVADFFPERRQEKLIAAVEALARLHRAMESFSPPRRDVAPSARQRLDILQRCMKDLPQHEAKVASGHCPAQMRELALGILEGFRAVASEIQSELNAAATMPVAIQPAIRDVWSDHILFDGDEVTGIVDFSALRPDSITVDLARLLGSMAGDDREAWRCGLESYQTIRPLDGIELKQVPIFDRSTTAMSGMNWLRWILLEGRRFENMDVVCSRLSTTLARLRCLLAEDVNRTEP